MLGLESWMLHLGGFSKPGALIVPLKGKPVMREHLGPRMFKTFGVLLLCWFFPLGNSSGGELRRLEGQAPDENRRVDELSDPERVADVHGRSQGGDGWDRSRRWRNGGSSGSDGADRGR